MDRRTFIKSSALITAAAASNSVFAELDKCNTIEENSINKGAKFYRNGKVAQYKGINA